MFCFASLIVLGFLSLFGAKYRSLAGEAFDCVSKRVTLRPCVTGFDVKIKSTILSALLSKSPTLARQVRKHFEVISFGFVFLFLASLIWSVRGGYLFWATGSCNGLNQSGYCAFDPSGKNNEVSGSGSECRQGGNPTGNLTLSKVNLTMFPQIEGNDKQIVFIGCYTCKYTKQTYPLIKQLIEKYNPSVRFLFYSTHEESKYLMNYDYCVANQAPEKYISWMDKLYTESNMEVASEAATIKLISSLGIDAEKISACVNNPLSAEAVQKLKYEIDKTGIYGTPTVFLNGVPVVGPKPYRVYRRLLNLSWF
jgi:protein-disulfide isomerase